MSEPTMIETTAATAIALRMLRDVATRSPLVTEAMTYKLAEMRIHVDALAKGARKAGLDALESDAEGTMVVVSALITILREAKK